MKLFEISIGRGNEKSYRKGRGHGSGNGKTAGKGHKGQKARGKVRRGFEGGQMPLYRRIPKRGFNNIFRTNYSEVNLYQLNSFNDGDTVTPELLLEIGIINKIQDGIVILGNGEINKKLTIKASKFTRSAFEKIEAAGGKAEVI